LSEKPTELVIELSLDGGDNSELDDLARQLKAEVEELSVDDVTGIPTGIVPIGTKGAELDAIGQMAVTLAPTLIPPLFELLKSWVDRKPSTPVKIRVRVGKRTAQIEYDPTKTSTKELEMLVKTLSKSIKG
jgi:hypothetical protein